jgi:hypothetical protein
MRACRVIRNDRRRNDRGVGKPGLRQFDERSRRSAEVICDVSPHVVDNRDYRRAKQDHCRDAPGIVLFHR